MTILFLLALFLAWPTYGLSIAVFGVFIVLRGYLIARANRMYANQSQAEQAVLNGARRLPTWAGNLTEIAVFKELQLKMTNRRGVSVHFVLALFADKASFDKLLFLAGAMEDLGASFNAQNVVVTDKIVAMWDHAPIDLKTRCIHQDQQSGDQSARPSTTKPARNRAGLMQAGAPRARASGRQLGKTIRLLAGFAQRVWRVVAVASVIAYLFVACFVAVTIDVVDGLLILITVSGVAFVVVGAIWLVVYGTTRSHRDFDAFVWKVIFGDLSVYVWSMIAIVYLGGAGNAIWHGPSDEAAFLRNFAVGSGVAGIFLLLGYPGRYIVSPKYQAQGHIVWTAVVALILLGVYLGAPSFQQMLGIQSVQL